MLTECVAGFFQVPIIDYLHNLLLTFFPGQILSLAVAYLFNMLAQDFIRFCSLLNTLIQRLLQIVTASVTQYCTKIMSSEL